MVYSWIQEEVNNTTWELVYFFFKAYNRFAMSLLYILPNPYKLFISWKNKNEVDWAAKATSTEDLQNSETTDKETPLWAHCISVYVTFMLHTFLSTYYFFSLDNRVRLKSYASCDWLEGSGGM